MLPCLERFRYLYRECGSACDLLHVPNVGACRDKEQMRMPKISIAGFKDPVRRPRYILWTGALVILAGVFLVVALGASSTRWFCANACHKVQGDTIIAYELSSHSEISCMACHMPVGADPVTFLLHKAKALGELYLTVTNNYHLPLNATSHLAQSYEMGSGQCTQCHSANRVVTPSEGIIIDHEIHEENHVQCTLCHNRVAHPENFTLTLKDPNTGEPNRPHDDFMKMTACFRCHGLTPDAKAPGECAKCHTLDFPLKPESHLAKDFYPQGHAKLAKEHREKALAAQDEAGKGEKAEEGDGQSSLGELILGTAFAASEEKPAEGEAEGELHLPQVGEVNYCTTCHLEQFCLNCHGMEMPHTEEFTTKSHPEIVKTKLDKCEFCHKQSKTQFCDACHHGSAVEWTYSAESPWRTQHAPATKKTSIKPCLERCHEAPYCSACHTREKPIPTSHRAKDWLRKGGAAIGAHAESSKGEIQSCEICHGKGGPNSKFCKSCHKYDMPHPDEFKKFHAKTGRANTAQCGFCHTFREVCGNCHHEGASNTVPWLKQHPKTVSSKGADGCFEKCHKVDFCVKCHTTSKVVPTSHKAKTWTRDASTKAALHTTAYDKQASSCAFCHGKGGSEDNKFCLNCHKLPMPHPGEFKDTHKDQFAEKKLNKTTCVKCHNVVFCNKCHHEGYTGKQTWMMEHQFVVKQKGAEPCFECHKPTYCSHCHVRLIH